MKRQVELNLSGVTDIPKLFARISEASQKPAIELAGQAELEISFVGFTGVSAPVFATLAAFATQFLENVQTVRLVWADGKKEHPRQVLAAMQGFQVRQYLLAECANRGIPVQELGFEHIRPLRRDRDHIPLALFNRESFRADEPIFSASPELWENSAHRLTRERLVREDFLTDTQAEEFRVSLFLELAWNAVLHSENIAGAGWSVFCARKAFTKQSENLFEWALADTGRGIEAALRAAAPSTYGISTNKNELLLQLGKRTITSRTAYPPSGSVEGNRGYNHIAKTALRNGSFSLMTSGVELALARGADSAKDSPKWTVARELDPHSPTGTVAWGEFRPVEIEELFRESGAIGTSWVEEATYVCLIAFDTQERIDDTQIGRLIAKAQSGKRLVLDFGFVEMPYERLYYTLKTALRGKRGSPIVVVNLRVPNVAELEALGAQLVDDGLDVPLPILFLNSKWKFTSLSLRPKNVLVKEAEFEQDPEDTPEDGNSQLATLLRHVNSEYLSSGMGVATQGGRGGFFGCNVQLFSGRVIGGYVAFGLNAAANSNAKMRWAYSVAAVIQSVIAKSHDRHGATVIAFSDPIREITEEAARLLNGYKDVDFHVLAAFEPPSSRELEGLLGRGRAVILLTDAVVVGSQLAAFIAACERVGERVHAAVVLADLRDAPSHFKTTVVPLSKVEVPAADPNSDLVLVPDPVSLIPRLPNPERVAVTRRAYSSLESLKNSSSIHQGHFEMNGRHGNLFIRTIELLSSEEIKQVRARISERLDRLDSEDRFSNFIPLFVMQPVGAPPIAALGGANSKLDTEHSQALEFLRAIIADLRPNWSGAMLGRQPSELRRFYDSTGALRYADIQSPDGWKKGADILILDDGLASGQSLRALLDQARTWGAGRIAVLVLLARAQVDEVMWWESIEKLICPNGLHAETAFLFPFIVPVPFFRADDCPAEEASSRIESLVTIGGDVKDSAFAISAELRPRALNELVDDKRSGDRAAQMLYLRGVLEIAALDPSSVSRLRHELESAHANLLPLINVLAFEPRLISRPRLRDWLSKLIYPLAIKVIADEGSLPADRLNSFVLMRTAMSEHLPDAVRALARSEDCPAKLVDRCAFHVLSALTNLAQPRRALQSAVEDLRLRVHEIAVSHGDLSEEEVELYRRGVYLLEEVQRAGQAARSTDQILTFAEAITDLVAMLREERKYHNLSTTLLAIARSGPYAARLDKAQVERQAQSWAPWPDIIQTDFLPPLKTLESFLQQYQGIYVVDVLTSEQPTTSPVSNEPVPQRLNARTNVFSKSVSGLTFYLAIAVNADKRANWIARAANEATQLYASVFDTNNGKLIQLARSLVHFNLVEAASQLAQSIRTSLGSGRVEVEIDPKLVSETRKLFMYPELWANLGEAVAKNVDAHGRQQGTELDDTPVFIRVTRDEQTGGVQFQVADSGPAHDGRASKSRHSRRLNEQLAKLDGAFEPTFLSMASNGSIEHMTVKQSIHVAFAPEQLEVLCARF